MDKIATKEALSEIAQALNNKIETELEGINTILESINGD